MAALKRRHIMDDTAGESRPDDNSQQLAVLPRSLHYAKGFRHCLSASFFLSRPSENFGLRRSMILIGVVITLLSLVLPASCAVNNVDNSAFFDKFMDEVVHKSWQSKESPNAERVWEPPKNRSTPAPKTTSSALRQNTTHGRQIATPMPIHQKVERNVPVTVSPDFEAAAFVAVAPKTSHQHRSEVTASPVEIRVTTAQSVTMAAAPVQLDMFSPQPDNNDGQTTPSSHSPTINKNGDDVQRTSEASHAAFSDEIKPNSMKRSSSAVEGSGISEDAAGSSGATSEPSVMDQQSSGSPEPEPSVQDQQTLETEGKPPVPETLIEKPTEPVVYTTTTPRTTGRTSTWLMTPRIDLDAFTMQGMSCGARAEPICCRGRDDSDACSIRAQLPHNQSGICYCDEHCLTVSDDFPIPDCCPDFLDTCAKPLGIDVSKLIPIVVTPTPTSQPHANNELVAVRTKGRNGKKIRTRPQTHKKKPLHKNKYARLQKVMQAFVIDPDD